MSRTTGSITVDSVNELSSKVGRLEILSSQLPRHLSNQIIHNLMLTIRPWNTQFQVLSSFPNLSNHLFPYRSSQLLKDRLWPPCWVTCLEQDVQGTLSQEVLPDSAVATHACTHTHTQRNLVRFPLYAPRTPISGLSQGLGIQHLFCASSTEWWTA